jgi:hypothetical protein
MNEFSEKKTLFDNSLQMFVCSTGIWQESSCKKQRKLCKNALARSRGNL